MRRVPFRTWGPGSYAASVGDGHVRVDDGETVVAAVCARITRSTGLAVVTCCPQGTALDNRGNPSDRHYEVTLGERKSGDRAYVVRGRLWFAVPVEREVES